jgi:hypothetical protein
MPLNMPSQKKLQLRRRAAIHFWGFYELPPAISHKLAVACIILFNNMRGTQHTAHSAAPVAPIQDPSSSLTHRHHHPRWHYPPSCTCCAAAAAAAVGTCGSKGISCPKYTCLLHSAHVLSSFLWEMRPQSKRVCPQLEKRGLKPPHRTGPAPIRRRCLLRC